MPTTGCVACLAARPCVCTLAGSGVEGVLDGPNATARLRFPTRVLPDKQGRVLVTEGYQVGAVPAQGMVGRPGPL